MCYCDQSIRTPCCGKPSCYSSFEEYINMPKPKYPVIQAINTNNTITPKESTKPIHASSFDKVPDKVVEYLNENIAKNWNGAKAEIFVSEIYKSTGLSYIDFYKVVDLFANYGWCMDQMTTSANEWLVFTIRK